MSTDSGHCKKICSSGRTRCIGTQRRHASKQLLLQLQGQQRIASADLPVQAPLVVSAGLGAAVNAIIKSRGRPLGLRQWRVPVFVICCEEDLLNAVGGRSWSAAAQGWIASCRIAEVLMSIGEYEFS